MDGTHVVCTDGLVSAESKFLVARIKTAAALGERVQVVPPFGDFIAASLREGDPVGNFAAMVVSSARWRIVEAPPEVHEFLAAQTRLGENVFDEGGIELPLGAVHV